jgi:tetratricopeptide (TPR) repeat protein
LRCSPPGTRHCVEFPRSIHLVPGRSLRLLLPLALLGLLVTALLGACSGERSESQRSLTRLPTPDEVSSEALMVALAQARNHHHKADVYLGEGNLPAAVESVQRVLSLEFPRNAAEAEAVKLDARARVAKLLVAQDQLDEALRVARDGTAEATGESFFLANLYTVIGEIHEARAARLGASDAAVATAERKQAISAYDRAIAINEIVQKQLAKESSR